MRQEGAQKRMAAIKQRKEARGSRATANMKVDGTRLAYSISAA